MTKKTCIIGAGPSGIAVAKIFKEQNVPFDCFEKGSDIGGNWRYQNDNGQSSCYKSLHIDSTKWVSAYPDYPMPDDFPDYPRHDLVLNYFESYVNKFQIRPHIQFKTEVKKVIPQSDNSFEVHLHNGEIKKYSNVIVANGHHWDPYQPPFEGTFSGKMMHSHYYTMPHHFENKKVLVIGIGNSAVDIASEVSSYADKTYLSTRSSAHIIPKYILGKPMVNYFTPFTARLPLALNRLYNHFLFWLARGSLKNYGFPKPNHKLWEAHPTVSSEIFTQIGHGDLKIKGDITKFEGDGVIFNDGSQEKFDTIIFATGYKITFPFLSTEIISTQDNKVDLFHNVVHPRYKKLFFAGLIQPPGSIMPLVHWQALWIANVINDKIQLPSESEMNLEIKKYHEDIKKRFKKSPRHTIEVDYYQYQQLMQSLIAKT